MKMHASVIVSLLSMPLLVSCNNDRAMSVVRDTMVANKQSRSAFPLSMMATTTESFFDGTTIEGDHNHDPAHIFQGRVLRELQFTEACNETYNALWEDQALNDAADVYSTGYDDATASLANCVDDSSTNSLKCSVDGPIDGETEYTTACTNAGGETMPIDFDLSCSGTLEGKASSVSVDMPAVLTCVPASSDFDSCADGIRELYQNVTDLMALVYEYGLTSGGYSQVSCSAGDVGTDSGAGSAGGNNNGGSSNAATRGMGLYSVAMFGISLIMAVF